jgi:hypothetical protein
MAYSKDSRRVARSLALFLFVFALLVGIIILLTETELDLVGYVLVIGAPFILGAIGYFVGLTQDVDGSD